ncbi:hypothetical protein GCM10010424_62960 [Streptomyces lienomycini]
MDDLRIAEPHGRGRGSGPRRGQHNRSPRSACSKEACTSSKEPAQGGELSLPADRVALDLLDARLEALWGGTDFPLPRGPVRLAAGGGGELARWALARLQSLPREPNDVFVRQVGSLPAEFRSCRCPWNAAALRLLDDTNTFVATGPRRHEDWAHDVRAVLHRSVPDPRGLGPAGLGPHRHRPSRGARLPF